MIGACLGGDLPVRLRWQADASYVFKTHMEHEESRKGRCGKCVVLRVRVHLGSMSESRTLNGPLSRDLDVSQTCASRRVFQGQLTMVALSVSAVPTLDRCNPRPSTHQRFIAISSEGIGTVLRQFRDYRFWVGNFVST
eukprot:4019217-Amphidinium_carterae.1